MKKRDLLIFVAIVLIQLNLHSQESAEPQPQKRIALVIGNGNYTASTLANPENDARSMELVLKKLGFVVYKYENLNQKEMKNAIDEFGSKLKFFQVGLFYYAGHGIQSQGYNYLIPVDAQLKSEEQVEYDCVQADRILGLMEGSGTSVNIVILDACRNNPFERSWTRSSAGKGLAFMNAPKGTLIAYATSPGNTASDGSGNNGLYTSAILESIMIPKLTILQMFQQVRSIVNFKSNDKQTPWESTSLTGDFYFNPGIIDSSEVHNKVTKSEIETNAIRENYIIDNRDQQRYNIIRIGKQIWMAENLKSNRYNDGTPIPETVDKIKWSHLESPSFCWYDNQDAYQITYGALYNWYAVSTGKLCPLGWHIPSSEEWDYLFSMMNGHEIAGAMLKEPGTSHWKEPNIILASSYINYAALPGGYRNENGAYEMIGESGYWWSSYDSVKKTYWYQTMDNNKRYVSKKNYKDKPIGLSVRCIQDN